MSQAQALGCQAVATALADRGCTQVVASPGYRSAPLLYALYRQPELQIHTVVDERSAGFVALGLAKASGQLIALSCTSGSALGNYMPAIMEARAAGIPLVIITADRPTELQESGANQTTRQVNFFAQVAAASDQFEFADVSDLEIPHPAQSFYRRVCVLCEKSIRRQGPVHLNLRLRKPLLPIEQPPGTSGEELRRTRSQKEPTGDRLEMDVTTARRVEDFCRGGVRGVIVDGPIYGSYLREHRERVTQLSRKLGWPIIADALAPTWGSAESIPQPGEWLDDVPDALRPERVIWLGREPIVAGVRRWLHAFDGPILHIHPGEDCLDPRGRAQPVRGDARSLAAVTPAHGPSDPFYFGAWLEYANQHRQWTRIIGPRHAGSANMVQRALDRWPYRWVHLGNSSVVRDAGEFVVPSTRLRSLGNRGLSGIDGTLATAWGECLALQQPLLLVLGDLSFWHDVGTLFQLPAGLPLAIAVLDNGGGQIFSNLAVAKLPEYEAAFLTPPVSTLKDTSHFGGFVVEHSLPEQIVPGRLYWLQEDVTSSHSLRERARTAQVTTRQVGP